ncbi:TPA: hypothetical protein HA338_08375 [Methanosarcina acetivorans]|uniref:Winged helix domain-containing protein n=2 Tax=Methanosarcina acetivorans TaxID=2214 RepID=Q8TP52_METAC|nr:hypothetical protein [Methanosarcina acetivorans]AAM05468.1 hypothetical protein (multi-domain) [Methanosarcina acetivorans C2A]HIH94043.1 hypothetical protein [Methanosarcina acetivorans]
MKPYANNLEHLLDELSRIDLMVQSYLEKVLESFPGAGDEFRGLYVSEAEIEQIQKNPGIGGQQVVADARIERHKVIEAIIEAIREEINARKIESLRKGTELRLHILSELFGLDPFEMDILLIGLAPELDLKYEKLYPYLQNDVNKKRPTVDLVLSMFIPAIEEKIKAREYFLPDASLRKNHLIHLLEGETNSSLSLISSFIKIDDRIVNFLLGYDDLDTRIGNFSALIKSKRSFEDLILPADFKSKLMNMAIWYSSNKLPLKLVFCGPLGSGKKSAAEAVCRVAGINLLVVNSRVLFEVQSLETSLENIDLIRREALLQNSALYLQAFDVVFDGKEAMNFAEALN